MPVRGYLHSNKDEYVRLNALLENAFKAEKDHRFIKLHQQKPIEDGWSRIYEYIPGDPQDAQLKLDHIFKEPTIIAHMGVLRQPMQFGKSIIINGGVRDVGTLKAVQGKGVGLIVARDAIKFMYEQDVDISILFSGARHFYEKSGWRGGFFYQNYIINQKQISELPKGENEYQARIIENSDDDLTKLSSLYSSSSEGLYFGVIRDKDYWKRHFETNPQIIWEHVGIFDKKEEMVGYFRFSIMNNNELLGIMVKECRVLNSDINYDQILVAFIDFIKEEAIDSKQNIDVIHLRLSEQHRIIKYLKERFPDLKEEFQFTQNHMALITNPYTLFKNCESEFIHRLETVYSSGNLSTFSLLFDKSGKFPGGAIFSINQKTDDGSDKINVNMKVYREDGEFLKDAAGVDHKIEFPDVSAMTIFFCNFFPVEDWDLDTASDFGVEFIGNGFEYMVKLFGGTNCAMYDLDHY